MLVTSGLLAMHGLAMHGAAGEPGAVGTGMPTMSTTAAMPTASHGVDIELGRQVADAAASMSGHPGEMCVALPVLLWLFAAMTATLVRRRDQLVASLSGLRVRMARAPPCPPPQVRGVCLT